MDCVWDLEEATVRQVQGRLRPRKRLAYTTVLTVMRILRDKGFLESRREGRADVYHPLVEREQIAGRSLREVMERFFSGSAAALVSHLMEQEDLDPAEVRAMRRELDEHLRQSAATSKE
jgi:BlaI family penicillinase repressor